MNQEIDNLIRYAEQQERENEQLKKQNSTMTNSLFAVPSEDNLIRWQLDLKEDLDRLYHLLQGHQIQEDNKGNVKYVEPINENLKPFNEFGVQLIMNIMSFYLNRNTLLSNYDEATINWKVFDFGNEIVDLIFNRYEEMGMDTDEKIKMYPMIVRELVDTVHSAYLRALNGGERESLRTARTVTQNESPTNPAMMAYNNIMPQKKFSLFKPSSWV